MADAATQDTSKATAATTENDKAEGEEIVQRLPAPDAPTAR